MSDTLPPALWYRQPAAVFAEALPLGNGCHGAMVYGGVGHELVELNADTLWSGGPVPPRSGPAPVRYLAELRGAVLAGRDYARADELSAHFQGPFGQGYQPLGALHLDFADGGEQADDYRRSLDLDRAVHAVEYRQGGVRLRREGFLSAPAKLLVLRLTADRPGSVSFTARLTSPHPADTRPAGPGTALLTGRAPAHLAFDTPDPLSYRPDAGTGFAAALRVTATGGTTTVGADGTLTVHGADQAVLHVRLTTGYRGWQHPPVGPEDGPAEESLAGLAAAHLPYADLLAAHTADHGALMRRSTLHLGPPAPAEDRTAPTDERLAAVRAGKADPGLSALVYAYGRYLLIASSRPGSQPANLQGVWNRDTAPPWNSNWTTNVNLPMNYWPAEATGLAECHEPLLRLVEDLAEAGAGTARDLYGCGGWTAHHNLDLWRPTDPVAGSPSWAMWPMAGAWLSSHLWQRYRYGGDRRYLAERAYPVLRGAAEFLLDFLTEDGEGRLVTCPSTSPEHMFRTDGGALASVSAASTCDYWLAEELLTTCALAARELGTDAEFAARLDAARAQLRPPATALDGRLLEWWEDLPEEDPGHRHFSHLYGLFPGDGLERLADPALTAAAAAALRRRLEHGGGDTGWSAAWAAALAARLGDAETAHRLLTDLLAEFSCPNLMGICPPGILQLDSSFGSTAAIAQLLLQARPQGVALLPALPAAWPEGRVTGLRAPGGLVVDLEWSGGRLAGARVTTSAPGEVVLLLPADTGPAALLDGAGRRVPARRGPGVLAFTGTEPGAYRLQI
ncbi:glycoside hydrolase family 95 protein [Kitasatospora cineracea]|uniref:glycoside hydrolase family 95 protein n=1 Tax=Kitasatospora cineracea TaxID=88074 RepID=UPI003445F037